MSETRIDQDPGLAQASYGLYRSRLNGLNSDFPQHQGLGEEEFRAAIANPLVIKTEVEFGERCVLPQLAPVTAFEWLHSPFYEEHFPAESAEGELLHFTDIPGVEPGEEVKERLERLARKSGALVFDYPSIDPQYPDRVKGLLGGLGIKSGDIETLGTQTYYAGELSLKREHERRDAPLTYPEAFDELVARGEFDASESVNGTSLQRKVEGEEAERLYNFYEPAYATISDHPCTQALSPGEFREMLTDTRVAKVVYRKNGIAETLCLVTNDLGSLTWINPEYYKKLYPEKYEKGQVVWFPGIATDPDPLVAGHNFPKIADLLTHLNEMGDNAIVVVFDAPDMNAGWLDQYIESEVNKTPYASIHFKTLGVQRYCAVKLGI